MEAEVPITKEMKGQLVEGRFDIEIIYGRTGDLKHKMNKRFKPAIKFAPNGEIESTEISELE